MSFSSDLLDGFETLNKRTDGVLKSSSEVSNFFKGLAKLERDYGKSLSKLASSQKVTFQKCGPVQKEVGSTYDSWDVILSELEKIGEHHSSFADRLENDLSKVISGYVKERQKVRKKLEADGQRVSKEMKQTLDNLQKARGKYVHLSKDADSAEASHTKGKGDTNMKPTQLAKIAAKSSQAAEKAASADNEYQATLNATNQKQSEYYTQTMPQLLAEFQQFEEERLQFMKESLEKFAAMFAEKPTAYSTTTEAITVATQSLNVQTDIEVFVNENRTGVSVPEDIPYIPYDSEQPAVPKAHKPNIPGKIGNYSPASSNKYGDKEWGLTAADSALTPEQKQTKLAEQLEELQKAINTESKAKEGLENLVRFYATDPVAQKNAEMELAESEDKVLRLTTAKRTVESQISELSGGSTEPPGMKARGLYDYTATCDTELTFHAGDILTITEQDDSGWWYAELEGRTGFIPNNYVTPLN